MHNCEDFNLVNVWNTRVRIKRANAMLTDVYTTAVCTHVVTVVADAKIPRLRKKEYSMTFTSHVL